MTDGDTAMQVRADQLVLRDCDDNGVLRLTLNDPKTRNSLSEAMMDTLARALADARDDADVRVIVIAANGPVFCAGHNLKEMTAPALTRRMAVTGVAPISPVFWDNARG